MHTPRSRRGPAATLTLLTAALLAALLTTLTAAAGPADAAPSGRATQKIIYPGFGAHVWRASGQLDRLAKTSPGFRHLIRIELNRLWGWTDKDPDCTQAPLVVVKEWRRRVAFASDRGVFAGGPGDAPAKCAGGGAYQFYVKRDGHWRRAFGGQDIPRCRQLRRWDIPRMHGATQCWNGSDVVKWDPSP